MVLEPGPDRITFGSVFALDPVRMLDYTGRRALRWVFGVLALGILVESVGTLAAGKWSSAPLTALGVGLIVAAGPLVYLVLLLGPGAVKLTLTPTSMALEYPCGRVSRVDLSSGRHHLVLETVSGMTTPGYPCSVRRLLRGVPRYNTLTEEAYSAILEMGKERGFQIHEVGRVTDRGITVTTTRISVAR